MKKEKTEELYVKWVDGLLTPEEESELALLMKEDPSLEPDLHQSRMVSQTIQDSILDSVEPPYGDFFNSQLMRKVELEIASKAPSKKAVRWWQSLRWAWAPAGGLALVLAFFAGHRMARPSTSELVDSVSRAQLDLVSVYVTSDQLAASVIADGDGAVSAIVIEGLEDLEDNLELAINTEQKEEGLDGLPVSYLRSRAYQFQ